MRVFVALLFDSYRELNSKKLFWVILAMSGMVVLSFGSIGFNDRGMSILFGIHTIENPLITDGSFVASMLYRSIFSSFMVGTWLAWIATILALISTTTIFPDFMAGGAIELVLSKPIGRMRLFIFKYLSSLLFVFLQVAIFCVGVFLCMGIRIGEWEWKIFAAIPLVVLFYSYLFSVNVLVGVWKGSALAALLLTFMFWTSIFGISFSETMLNMVKTGYVVKVEQSDERVARLETTLELMPVSSDDRGIIEGRRRIEDQIELAREDGEPSRAIVAKLERWQYPIRRVQSVLPKTGETILLLDRWLRKDSDVNLFDLVRGTVTLDAEGRPQSHDTSRDREVERRIDEELESRSGWYVLGTSIAFELVVLSLAGFLFVRRDY